MKRILAMLAGASALSGAALAKSDLESAIEAALACRGIAGDAERLSCLDAAAGSLQSARDKLVAGKADKSEGLLARFGLRGDGDDDEVEDDAVPNVETVEDFGAEGIFAERHAKLEEKLDEIDGTVTSIRLNSRREATLYLDNGQVWRQVSADDKMLTASDKDDPYPVTIKRSAFGAYIAKVSGLNRSIRVRRIK